MSNTPSAVASQTLPLPPQFADTVSVSDRGAVITLTFFGPSAPAPNTASVPVPVACIAIPRDFAPHMIKAVSDALSAATIAQAAAKKSN